MSFSILTKNTRKFKGNNAERDAQRFIDKRRKWDQWWEFVENCHGHAIVMRRRCRE